VRACIFLLQIPKIEFDLAGVSVEQSDSIVKLGCVRHLISALAKKYEFEFVIIDLNPVPSRLNLLWMLA